MEWSDQSTVVQDMQYFHCGYLWFETLSHILHLTPLNRYIILYTNLYSGKCTCSCKTTCNPTNYFLLIFSTKKWKKVIQFHFIEYYFPRGTLWIATFSVFCAHTSVWDTYLQYHKDSRDLKDRVTYETHETHDEHAVTENQSFLAHLHLCSVVLWLS